MLQARETAEVAFRKRQDEYSIRSFGRNDFILLAAAFLVQSALFCFLAFHRLIDSDEGFYLYISKLVITRGDVIYRDVFYQQMPLLPYVYGIWMKLFGFSWEAGRLLSALLAALIGTMLFRHVQQRSGLLLAACSLLLYALNLSVLLFFLTAKTYVLSAFFLFASLLAAARVRDRSGGWAAMGSGLLLAFSVQTRLFFAAAVPVFALWFWNRRDKREAGRPTWFFIGGFALGCIPSLIFLTVFPGRFIYDNILYHAMRDPAGLVGDVGQKLEVAGKLVAGVGTPRPTQFSFLLCGVPLSLLTWKRLGGAAKLALFVSLAIGLVSFLPTPTFGQYFCVLVPFLVICLAEGFKLACEPVPGLGNRRLPMAGFMLLCLAYAFAAFLRMGPLFVRGEEVPGIAPTAEAFDWKLPTVKKIASVVEHNTGKDSLVVTSWPGYLLTIDRNAYPKMENQISIGISWKLSPREADEYRMLREEDIPLAIADQRVQAIVAGNCTNRWRPLYRKAADMSGYELAYNMGNSDIYIRRPGRTGGGEPEQAYE